MAEYRQATEAEIIEYREKKDAFLAEIDKLMEKEIEIEKKKGSAYSEIQIERLKYLGDFIKDKCSELFHSACTPEGHVDRKPESAKKWAERIKYILYTASDHMCGTISFDTYMEMCRLIKDRTGYSVR